MRRTKSDLEERVFKYNPRLREKIEHDPEARRTFDGISDPVFKKYSPYINEGRISGAIGSLGRAAGYAGDILFAAGAVGAAFVNPALSYYMLAGLAGKKVGVAAQVPEDIRAVRYGAETGDIKGAGRKIGGSGLSYIPGGTFLDKPLRKIAEDRAVQRIAYRANKVFGFDEKPWNVRNAEKARRAGYTGVKDRDDNIIRVDFKKKRLAA